MGEIKFRAWDGQRQAWSRLTQAVSLGGDPVYIDADDRLHKAAGVIVTQYTGLKDRKGQEIYENDVVTFDDAHWLVVFDGSQGWVLKATSPDNYNPHDMPNLYMQELANYPGLTRTDVVGNIYENPELLKS